GDKELEEEFREKRPLLNPRNDQPRPKRRACAVEEGKSSRAGHLAGLDLLHPEGCGNPRVCDVGTKTEPRSRAQDRRSKPENRPSLSLSYSINHGSSEHRRGKGGH